MLNFGVEEEFLLLEPGGTVAPVARDVLRLTGVDGAVKPEFMAYQVETSTGVCNRLDQLRDDLIRLRGYAAYGARRAGVHLVATGLPPFPGGAVDMVSPEIRQPNLARFPGAIAAGGACACQVHVEVPDRDLRVEVLARLRPWLSTLLTLTANSPFTAGVDTGWSSNRYRALLHWPTFRPPGLWTSAERYDRVVQTLIASGLATSPRGVYFLARLSARYPTVEVRVADACLTVDDAVLLAAVVRALVEELVDDALRGRPIEPAANTRIQATLLSAAHGTSAAPNTAPPAFELLRSRLLAKVAPALAASGDLLEVEAELARIGRDGTGAERQRDMWARSSSPAEFVSTLARTAVAVPVG